jgi:hypothetical protein
MLSITLNCLKCEKVIEINIAKNYGLCTYSLKMKNY